MASVANPLKADLDCGKNRVTNATLLGADVVSFGGAELYGDGNDPAANGHAGSIGSLLSRRWQDTGAVTRAELWFKHGVTDTDWARIYP